MSYNLFLSDNTITPFVIVSDNTIDTTTTSIAFIGRQKIGYGQAQDQNFLWMLENFSNGTPPAQPLVGQTWFDSINDELKVYNNELIWKPVGSPPANSAGPSSPGAGDLWFDTVNQVLKAWNGSAWIVIGPSQQLAPVTAYEQIYSANITSDATTTELWKNGVTGSRLNIPSNTTWMFEIAVTSRRVDSGHEFAGWKIKGVINNTSGTVYGTGSGNALVTAIETYGDTSAGGWTVGAVADNVNTAVGIFVTGQTGKTISWSSITTLIKVQ